MYPVRAMSDGPGAAVEDQSSGVGINGTIKIRKYKGVRRRRWGKWVSEIRVPGTQERLWLGSYSTPEAAAIAHDTAFYYLRRPSSLNVLNFPSMLMLMLPAAPSFNIDHNTNDSKSIQRAASDAGMAMDAQMIINSCSGPSFGDYEMKTNTKTTSVMCKGTDQWWPWEWDKDSSSSSAAGMYEAPDHDQPLSISIEDYL